jgi:hypothetical protein
MAGALEQLALDVLRSAGPDRNLAFQDLRAVIQRMSLEELTEEIRKVEKPYVMSVLLGAGLPAGAQDALTERWRELRRREG